MSVPLRVDVKGWCPGALRPMESGDGLVVRVRPRAGAFSLPEWALLAGAAAECGNSYLDLTRRANVQIRGVTSETLPLLQARLGASGLIDDSADAEAVRNIMLSPMTGLDVAEAADLRPVASALAEALARAQDLHLLAAKFGFVLDGGGTASMQDDRADIRLLALDAGTLAVGFDTSDETVWVGCCSVESAVENAVTLARLFQCHGSPDGSPTGGRFRNLTDNRRRALVTAAARCLAPLPAGFTGLRADVRRPIGLIAGIGAAWLAGVGVPFGQMTVAELTALIDAAVAARAVEMRLSPWRILYVPCQSRAAAESVLACAERQGLPTQADAPLLRFAACPGAPSCSSAAGETRAVARGLADAWPNALSRITVHVSGCRKGCAASHQSDLTLVAEDGGFAVITTGRAADQPLAHIDAAALASDPARLLSLLDGVGHA